MANVVKNHLEHAEAAMRAHRDLEKHIQQVVLLGNQWQQQEPDCAGLLAGAEVLSKFRHDLICHFIWEECDGYMDPVLRHDPSRYADVDRLRRDHEAMRRTMAELHHETILAAYGGPVDVGGLPSRLLALVKALREHEAHEHALVQDCFYRDVGAKD